MFTRTHQYQFSIPKEHLKYRLVGHHVKIHDMDFELQVEDQDLSIVPHAEEGTPITTFPFTQVELRENGNKTQMVITSKMRPIDAGGPILLMLFCVFFLVASLILFFVGKDPIVTICLGGISLLVFTLFLIRLQRGYFDYVRKIRAYVKVTGDEITTDVRRQLFKHKVR
jgi:hypothetical protein